MFTGFEACPVALDSSGRFLAENERRFCGNREVASADDAVQRINRRGFDPYQYLIGVGCRLGKVCELEDLWSPLGLNLDSFHLFVSFVVESSCRDDARSLTPRQAPA
jgi:hypothetical protein